MAIDTVAARAELRDNWNAISAGWTTWQDRFERGGAAVTRRLLKLAGVRAGHRVLDVGTGLGEPALTAARAVGPSGKVVGIDVSDEMLNRASARADAAHLTNVEFVVSDPESFDPGERFDVVLSRWCLMLTPDRMAALRALRRLLVAGGVLAAAVEPGRCRTHAVACLPGAQPAAGPLAPAGWSARPLRHGRPGAVPVRADHGRLR